MALPLIIVTATDEASARPYRESVERRGGKVRLAIPGASPAREDLLAGATALMLTGGPDVDPALYGEAPDPEAGLEVNRRRDDMELLLLRQALDRDLPVLAICRGMQLLNVALGGKLIQDLPGHKGEKVDGEWQSAYHQIYLSPGSKLAAILGSGGFMRVNSIHHQGLREAQKAQALMATAYSLDDGLIEGLESPAHDWVIGLQCHPEREDEVPSSFGRLFQAFVERAESRQ
ncbi:MAG: gamma-glutamyl-gamma-aminobutyrate hydrolase family protein [Chloroflexi bacterium]|nr:gamma-glutamyl-gamma-aminobutyrate hydrolase family protein [Chloroflexota bacterium]